MSSPTEPAASVVVPTRNRARLLELTLETLSAQEGASFEVVVVDHGSSDTTASVCARYARRLPLETVSLPFRGTSISEPKNAGLEAAAAPLTIFVDSGILCPRGFVAAHVAAHADGAARLAWGRIHAFEEEDDAAELWGELRLDDVSVALVPPGLRDERPARLEECAAVPWLLAWGCNMSAGTDLLRGLGGFDPVFVGWGWDDLELAFRLELAGASVDPAPGADAVHYPHPRTPVAERWRTATENWLRAYDRHRHPALELWPTCWYWDYAPLLAELTRRLDLIPPELRALPRDGDPRAAGDVVWWGFEAGHDDRRAAVGFARPEPGQPARPGESFGLRTPFPDGRFDTAVVSRPYLDALRFHVNPVLLPLADHALREAERVARRVVVVDPAPAAVSA
jgi:GT2 family glycosyltransferase